MRSNRIGPMVLFTSHGLETSDRVFFDTRIMAKKRHNKNNKLRNSDELDLSWREAVHLARNPLALTPSPVRGVA
ncbi:MAG: hypothetical protein ACXVIS_06290 [Halobacteriota archaeon]